MEGKSKSGLFGWPTRSKSTGSFPQRMSDGVCQGSLPTMIPYQQLTADFPVAGLCTFGDQNRKHTLALAST